MNLSNYAQYSILVLAAVTAILPILTGLITREKTKKRLNLATIALIVAAGALAIRDAVIKDGENRASSAKQGDIINTAHATLGKVNSSLDSMGRIQDKLDKDLFVQNQIINRQRELNERSQKMIRSQQSLVENSIRQLSPLVPMYVTIYIEFPMNQPYLDSLNYLAVRNRQMLRHIADSVEKEQIERAKFAKNRRRAYGGYENPDLFTVRVSDYRSPSVRSTFANMIANTVSLYSGDVNKWYSDSNFITLSNGYGRNPSASTKLQADWNEKKYLLTIQFLIEEVDGRERNGIPLGFSELRSWNLHFANVHYDYKLRMIALRSKGGLVNHCLMEITESNVVSPYSFIDSVARAKEYGYRITKSDFTTMRDNPFPRD
jgi:hypothetical protein